jgi:hypothetical protein
MRSTFQLSAWVGGLSVACSGSLDVDSVKPTGVRAPDEEDGDLACRDDACAQALRDRA